MARTRVRPFFPQSTPGSEFLRSAPTATCGPINVHCPLEGSLASATPRFLCVLPKLVLARPVVSTSLLLKGSESVESLTAGGTPRSLTTSVDGGPSGTAAFGTSDGLRNGKGLC